MTSRFVSSLLTAVLLAGSYSAEAAVKLGRQFTGARDDDERTRVLTERPLASQGLKGLREQGRSALRPAKLENKADGKVLVATTTPAARELRETGLATAGRRELTPKLTTREILRTNLPELLVVKALTSMGVSHDALAHFAMSQGQGGIQSGWGKIHSLGDGAVSPLPFEQPAEKPAKRTKRSVAEDNSR